MRNSQIPAWGIAMEALLLFYITHLIANLQLDWYDFAMLSTLFIGCAVVMIQRVILKTQRNKIAFCLILISGLIAIITACITYYTDSLIGKWGIVTTCFFNVGILFYFAGLLMYEYAKKKEPFPDITLSMVYTMPTWAFPFIANSCIH